MNERTGERVDWMSETANADLFKSRLAQLKKVLERDAKIAENLFYAALQLDKSNESKSGVQEVIEKHRMKVKKGYLCLPDDEKDRPAAVKALLKDAFEFLLKAFNVDKSQLVQRKPSEQKVHALQLFEMQSTLEAQIAAQAGAFETTMQDLDKIDTSTPLEQSVIVPPPSDGEESVKPEPLSPQAPKQPVVPMQPTTISKLAIAEQTPEAGPPSGVKPAIHTSVPVSPIAIRKPIPLPPRSQQRGTIQATPVVPVAVHVPIKPPTPNQKPTPVVPVVVQVPLKPPTPAQKPLATPALVPTRKPAPSPPAAAKPAPAPAAPMLRPVPSPPAPVTQAPAPTAPVPTPAPAPPSPMIYEYYVCNRCGEETSKSVIRQVGAFIECPKCKFTFSRAEATVIQKAAPGADQAARSGQEETKAQFELFASKQPGEDESLVRPSMLFADREKESAPVVRKVTAKPAEGSRIKPRPEPTERLVRPSEFLGLAASPSPSEAEKIVRNEASEYNGEQASSPAITPPAIADTEKIAEAPASEYFVEEQPELRKVRHVPNNPVQSAPMLAAPPSENPAPGDTCPKCGASKYSKIQDRSKVISYNPLMYGTKKRCTMCSHEFD